MEASFDTAIRRLADAPLVGEIRTVGLTAAVAIKPELLASDAGDPGTVVGAALRHGVATRVLRGHALQISPAFTITPEEVDVLVDGLGRRAGGRRRGELTRHRPCPGGPGRNLADLIPSPGGATIARPPTDPRHPARAT